MSDMTVDLDKNIEELKARGALTMQLLLLVIMGMFLSLHVVLSFAVGGMLSLLSDEEWISTSLLYLQSWEFSRISVGIPFVVLSILLLRKCLKHVWPDDIREVVLSSMRQFAQGRRFAWRELGAADSLYRHMLQMAKNAGINTPRMFWCSIDIDNAFTISTRNEDAIVVFEKAMHHPLLAPFAEATIAHEIGHIISRDCKRDVFLSDTIDVLRSVFIKGLEFYCLRTKECLINRNPDVPMYIAITSAGFFLILGVTMMLIGIIPWSWAKSLSWWRAYTAEYMADGLGAKLLSDPMLMPDGMILSHVLMQGFLNVHDCTDVHPPDVGRVRRFMPNFNGDWELAAQDVVRRRRLSC